MKHPSLVLARGHAEVLQDHNPHEVHDVLSVMKMIMIVICIIIISSSSSGSITTTITITITITSIIVIVGKLIIQPMPFKLAKHASEQSEGGQT